MLTIGHINRFHIRLSIEFSSSSAFSDSEDHYDVVIVRYIEICLLHHQPSYFLCRCLRCTIWMVDYVPPDRQWGNVCWFT